MSTSTITRYTARMVLVDHTNNILLLKIDDPSVLEPGKGRKKPFWVTPGGKIEAGETEIQALQRELFEETGIDKKDAEFGPCVWKGECDLIWKGKFTHLVEKFFLIKVKANHISTDHREEEESKVIQEHKWLSLKELESSSDIFIPKDLPKLFHQIVNGDTSLKEIDLTAPENLYERV